MPDKFQPECPTFGPCQMAGAGWRIRLTPAVGICIYRRRVRLGLSQRRLAEISHVSRSEICALERGRPYGPRLDIVERICEGLGISIMELMAEAYREALTRGCGASNCGLTLQGPAVV